MATIGIIGAMQEEVAYLISKIEDPKTETHVGREYVAGTLSGVPVVVCRCGVGLVAAATCAATMVETYGATAVINTGVAGSLDNAINIGDIVISTSSVLHDMDACALGYAPGQNPDFDVVSFEADETLKNAALAAVETLEDGVSAHLGIVASGQMFVSSPELKDRIVGLFGASCCEMEGAAIAQVCYMAGVPYLVIRAISDKADGSAHMDYPAFEKQAAVDCAAVVLKMLASL